MDVVNISFKDVLYFHQLGSTFGGQVFILFFFYFNFLCFCLFPLLYFIDEFFLFHLFSLLKIVSSPSHTCFFFELIRKTFYIFKKSEKQFQVHMYLI